MHQLLLVTPNLLPHVWPHVISMFLMHKKHWEKDFELKDIYEWLNAGRLFMWCTNNETEFTGIIIGCFCVMPRRRTFNIIYSNIDDLDEIIDYLDCIEMWAKRQQTQEVTVLAMRAGWVKKLHKRGYELASHVISKDISGLEEH